MQGGVSLRPAVRGPIPGPARGTLVKLHYLAPKTGKPRPGDSGDAHSTGYHLGHVLRQGSGRKSGRYNARIQRYIRI